MTISLSAGFLAKDGGIGGGSYEPQRTSTGLLYVALRDMPILTDVLGIGVDLAQVILALSVDTFNLPSYGVEVMNLGYFNETVKFPGKATVDELTWTVRDFVDVETADILDLWYALTFNPKSGVTSKASVYKRNVYAVLFGADGEVSYSGEENTPENRWYKLVGAYPSRIERGDIDHGGSDYVKINVTLTIDRVIPVYLDSMGVDETAATFAGNPWGAEPANTLPIPANLS